MFEQGTNEDVLELYAGSPTEVRYWLAAMQSPRYLKARGEHLMSAVEGVAATDNHLQVDLWRRWSVINLPDRRGEGLLAAALRGVEPGDHVERNRLIAYLLDLLEVRRDTGPIPSLICCPSLWREIAVMAPIDACEGGAQLP